MTPPSQHDLMFDADLSAAVASFLVREHDLPAEVEEYEIGMSQVRMDPTDTSVDHGWVAVAGETTNSGPGWVLIPTSREVLNRDALGEPLDIYYGTIDPGLVEDAGAIDLGLNLNEAPDKVAEAIAEAIAAATPTAKDTL